MSVDSTDKGLLTSENCAVVFIDHQEWMFSGISDAARRDLIDKLMILAKAASIFGVPVILTAARSPDFSGEIIPQLGELFPELHTIARSSMNAWDCPEFVTAVRKTGRRNMLVAALWSEASLVFPALQMMEEGYYIYVVWDASSGTSAGTQDVAIRRLEQAGAVSMSAIQVLLELQRDWARNAHYDDVISVLRAHSDAHDRGAGRAGISARKPSGGRRKRHD